MVGRWSTRVIGLLNAYREAEHHRCQGVFDRWYPEFRHASDRYEEMIGEISHPDSLILDLGCGRMSLAAEQFRGAKLSVGVDLGLDDLRQNTDVDFSLLANGESLPFEPRTFDLVVSQWAAEHFENPPLVFSEISRVLKQGGSCVVFTTCAYNYIPIISKLVGPKLQNLLIAAFLRRPKHESYPTHYRANTPKTLASLSKDSGLVVHEIIYVGNPFYLSFSVFLFRLALLFERITDRKGLRHLKLYLLFVARKPE